MSDCCKTGFNQAGHASCCGCYCTSFGRRFITAKEKKERLEEYKSQLKKEMEGVEEHIAKLGDK